MFFFFFFIFMRAEAVIRSKEILNGAIFFSQFVNESFQCRFHKRIVDIILNKRIPRAE